MATEADKLAIKLESYVLQLREVEAALKVDPTHVDLIKIKADLNELIDLTKKILTDKLNAGVTITAHNGYDGPGSSRSSGSRSQSAAKTEVPCVSESQLEPMPSDEYIKMLTDFGSSMQSELQQLGISISPEDGKFFAMLHEWRKRVGQMRLVDDPEIVLPTKIMATLASSKPATEAELMKILDEHQCINDHNKCQTAMILKLLNDGTTFFERMLKCMCNNCGLFGHVAKFCLRPQNSKAANKVYRKYFPEKWNIEIKRRRTNLKRNRRLKKGLPI